MLSLLDGLVCRLDSLHIVLPQVQRTEDIEGDFAVEAEPLETNGRDFIARFVEGVNL